MNESTTGLPDPSPVRGRRVGGRRSSGGGSTVTKKDLVTRERDGRAWRYLPADTREALTAQTMRRTMDDMDLTDRRTALLHFLDGATSDEIADLKAALAEIEGRAEGEGPPPSRRRGLRSV